MSTADQFEVGYWLSSEEHGPRSLVDGAVRAEAAGFAHAMISDHFHPWLPAQGHAPFVWGVLGAIAQATSSLHLSTGVSAPIWRIHPAVLAQAAATAAVLLEGRFALGLGTGERLNEHITGQPWPRPAVRRRMLREAIDMMRPLFEGKEVNAEGRWHTTEHAQLFTRPVVPPPIWIAASGRRSAKLAGRSGDGMLAVAADATLVDAFAATGGEGKPCVGQMHVCWAADDDDARRTVARWWPNGALPPILNTELERPRDFAAACELVDEATAAGPVTIGHDPEQFARAALRFAAAGFGRVYVHQIGPDQPGFLQFWTDEVSPLLRD